MQVPSSERLTYSMMDESDTELLYQLDQDVEVMRYINGGNKTTREDIEQRFIPRLLRYRNPEQGWGLWKVSLKASQEYIGWILIRPMHFFSEHPEYNNLEIGWRFFQKSWGFGYATEAAARLIETVQVASNNGEINRIDRISAIAMPGNQASIGVMKKLGLNYLKTSIHRDPLGDQEVVYYEKSLS